MHKVAKLIIVDHDDNYLMMYRSNHPVFGEDPDLPGGTLEDGEAPLQTMLREVEEEAGIIIDANMVRELYAGSTYSSHGTDYHLFIAHTSERPTIVMSWEHSSYEWIDKHTFLSVAKGANDTYMHMVHDVLKKATA